MTIATVDVTRIRHNTRRLAHRITITSTVNTSSDFLEVVLEVFELLGEAVDTAGVSGPAVVGMFDDTVVVVVADVVVIVVVADSVHWTLDKSTVWEHVPVVVKSEQGGVQSQLAKKR